MPSRSPNGKSRIEWAKKIAGQIKSEAKFWHKSRWESSWGLSGKYLWGYDTRAPGPGVTITVEKAELELEVAVRTAIAEFEDVFMFCPVEICEVRGEAIVRLLFYCGLPRFLQFRGMIMNIFKGDWAEAAYQLRSDPWYDDWGQQARRIVHEIRDGRGVNEETFWVPPGAGEK
jgi:GH24 family phage-related lysozyme (muramidase)